VLINNTTFQSQIEDMVNTKIKNKVEQYEKENNSHKRQVEEAEQYLRRNCLVIHGVQNKKGKITHHVVKNFFSE